MDQGADDAANWAEADKEQREDRAAHFARLIGNRTDSEVKALFEQSNTDIPIEEIAEARDGGYLGYGLAASLADALELELSDVVALYPPEVALILNGMHSTIRELLRRTTPPTN